MEFDAARFCRALVQDMAHAVVYSDAAGSIRFWNRGAERLFGYSEDEALGQSLDIIIPENLRPRHWTGFEATMRTGETRYGASDVLAVPAIRKDGSRISVEFSIVPFRDDAGRMIGIAAVLRDVTARFEEMKQLRKEIAALKTEAGP
jgi:PAS domain S-box-containing protein